MPRPTRLAQVIPALLLGVLALPAWARDLSIPAKNPAVTLTVPDTWHITDNDDGMQAQSPDQTFNFYLEYGPRSGLDAMMKNNRDWMKRTKINAAVKPTERTMDFSGVPGRVLRYDTKDKDGKTLVDFVTLDASDNRVVMLTLWGSEEQRADIETDLAAIMKSVRVTPSTTSFWAGGSAAKPEPAKPAVTTSAPDAPKVAAAPAAEPPKAEAPAAAPPARGLAVRRLTFIKRPSESFGDIDARNSDVFDRSEKVITYFEPVGETVVTASPTQSRFGVIIDYEVRKPDGTVVGGQKAVFDREYTMDTADLGGSDPRFYFDQTLGISVLDPGAYVLGFTVRDKFSNQIVQFEKPFRVAASEPQR